jgi:hypothetical protein
MKLVSSLAGAYSYTVADPNGKLRNKRRRPKTYIVATAGIVGESRENMHKIFQFIRKQNPAYFSKPFKMGGAWLVCMTT